MELLIFGHAGLPCLVFPTSCGRFYEFENRDMVGAISGKIDRGEVQLFCVDSVDAESWYNREAPPDWRIARHLQYERYLLQEVLPLIRQRNGNPQLAALGCSFGGYHAANITLRHPDLFTAFLSMSGIFDVSFFLRGYHSEDVYFNQPAQYIANTWDHWHLDRYRQGTYILATGEHDQCWTFAERMAAIFREKSIPHRLDVWGHQARHDWPYWHQMIQHYL